MNKLIYLLIPLALGFFSCNRKTSINWEPLTEKEIKQRKGLLDSIVRYNQIVDSISSEGVTFGGEHLTIDSNTSTSFRLSIWEPTLDTSDVIVTHIVDWELPTISIVTGKIVYPTSRFGVWTDVYGKAPDSKFFKVKDGVWTPVEWPKDIVNVYIRPKK